MEKSMHGSVIIMLLKRIICSYGGEPRLWNPFLRSRFRLSPITDKAPQSALLCCTMEEQSIFLSGCF